MLTPAIVVIAAALSAAQQPQLAEERPATNKAAAPTALPDEVTLTIDQLIGRLPSIVNAEPPAAPNEQDGTSTPARAAAELSRRIAAGAPLEPGQWQTLFTRKGILRLRPRWIAGEAITAAMYSSSALPPCTIQLTPRDKSLRPLGCGGEYFQLCGNGIEPALKAQANQTLGTLPPGKHEVVFDVVIQRPQGMPPWIDGEPPIVYWKGEVTVPIEVGATLDDVMPATDTPEAASAIRASIGISTATVGEGTGARDFPALVFDANVSAHPALASVAVSATVIFLRDGSIRQHAVLRAPLGGSAAGAQSVYPGPVQFFSVVSLIRFPAAALLDPEEAAHWTIRVKGDYPGSLNLWHANKRWTGTIEMPLTEVIRNERDRAPGRVLKLKHPSPLW